jgi:hypothetical protein
MPLHCQLRSQKSGINLAKKKSLTFSEAGAKIMKSLGLSTQDYENYIQEEMNILVQQEHRRIVELVENGASHQAALNISKAVISLAALNVNTITS